MKTLRQRAEEEYEAHEIHRKKLEEKAEKEASKKLTALMRMVLETRVDAEGKNIITIDGLTFTTREDEGYKHLFLIQKCQDCNEDMYVFAGSLLALGYKLKHPEKHIGCKAIPAVLRKRTTAEKLESLIRQIVREAD